MTENKRYKVAIYDEKEISGYCVLDLENPSQTARLKYKNVYISTEYRCNIICDLLNKQDKWIKELKIENEAQSDAIDGLQEFMAHHNLEEGDVE